MRSVLFVCSANICRSPMAEALLKAKIGAEIDKWKVASAGIWALEGKPVAVNTRFVLLEKGIELKTHSSQQVTRELVAAHSLILTMERNQKEALKLAFPEFAQRIYLFSEMVNEKHNLVDPIGGSLEDFRETMQEMERILDTGFERIRHLAEGQEMLHE